ncbi:HypC/HybG/HupF family hydrogenase formation chaperone [Tepidicella xavieri]|jgi:hydrogenase expression/formation protein HypC|uniref:Hydrogenase maturation protein HypC n=1 Tax=Tepidicella xavieri TaxID=360241 RepID=A0A4R6U498_9BURK|nr:HypC/HybG/HupF family hydrogenase formation chaperone [Tepidicella xavieri]TDQ40941.1 hydrogenase maturation protein HypC [Tepidicella xavieri]
MCLAVPARVVELLPPQDAWVELDGVRQRVSLALLDAVQVGDYVIVHVGFALQVIDEAEAQATLAQLRELQRETLPPPLP